ncbi:MAG: endonuclease domain-containing protein [Proteobacteria bacterium]|nr:endonuclease domain-containing protein [Pseudomonadota bacterium]MBS0554483.1 endonuclease domain-containing protein [Pseudomonadota bacterium]
MRGQTNVSILDNGLQRRLRNNMTDAEAALWRRLRGRQLGGNKFRRQHPFLDYVLDFVCVERGLVVEVDGGQHLDSPDDRRRDERLLAAGFRVLRFWNHEVLIETDAVLRAIWSALNESGDGLAPAKPLPHPHPSPPLEGEGV